MLDGVSGIGNTNCGKLLGAVDVLFVLLLSKIAAQNQIEHGDGRREV
jgi:hypothetical protein